MTLGELAVDGGLAQGREGGAGGGAEFAIDAQLGAGPEQAAGDHREDEGALLSAKIEQHGIEASSHEGKGRAHTPLDTYIGVEGDASTGILLDFLRRHTESP